MSDIKYVTSLLTAVLECLFFSGILFGWSSLAIILQLEGYFSSQCDQETNFSLSTTDFRTRSLELTTTTTYNFTQNYLAEENTRIFNSTQIPDATLKTIAEGNTEAESSHCIAEQLNLVFVISSSFLSFSALFNGYIYDKFGTWISRAIGLTLFTIGCILMATSSIENSWVLFPAMTCFAIGGIFMLITNMQVGNLFGRYRSSIMTLLSGAFDSSSFVFLFFNILYNNGISINAIFHVVAWCTVLLWLRTFLLLPRLHIPFPISKGYDYGLVSCKSKKPNDNSKEMNLVNVDVADLEQQESLTKQIENTEESAPVPSVFIFIKTSLFWGNVMHFSLLQLRNYFFLGSLIKWLEGLAGAEYPSYLVAFGICQLFGIVFSPLNGLLIDTGTRMLKKRSKFAELVPLKAVMLSAFTTTVLGTIFSIVVIIPSLPLQYMSFILQVIFRSFLYGGNFSFIAIAFPGEHFGTLYGLTMFIGGCVGLLQFPLFAFALRTMGGDFYVINVVFLFISLATLFHPFNIYRWCKKKADKKEISIIHMEQNN